MWKPCGIISSIFPVLKRGYQFHAFCFLVYQITAWCFNAAVYKHKDALRTVNIIHSMSTLYLHNYFINSLPIKYFAWLSDLIKIWILIALSLSVLFWIFTIYICERDCPFHLPNFPLKNSSHLILQRLCLLMGKNRYQIMLYIFTISGNRRSPRKSCIIIIKINSHTPMTTHL